MGKKLDNQHIRIYNRTKGGTVFIVTKTEKDSFFKRRIMWHFLQSQ